MYMAEISWSPACSPATDLIFLFLKQKRNPVLYLFRSLQSKDKNAKFQPSFIAYTGAKNRYEGCLKTMVYREFKKISLDG